MYGYYYFLARNMAFSLLHRGFHVLGLNMRGVGAAKLRTPRFASAHRGSTGDLREAGMSKKGRAWRCLVGISFSTWWFGTFFYFPYGIILPID
jgi:predicted alpha/beta-fold hydrolase